MPDDVKLLPCAHCGGNNINSSHIRDGRSIGCRDCGASVHAFQPNAEAEARAKWNRRTLPSHPSDIDGLVEELEAVTAAVLYTCADCEEGGNYEGMCHAADNCVLLDGRVLCEDCYSDGHYPKGAPRIPDIKKSLDRLIAALSARQAPEGAVEDAMRRILKVWRDNGIKTSIEPESAELAARAALSAMPSRAVKELDLSNLLKHAFLSGVVAARSIPPGDECDGPALWVDYDPEGCPAFARIRSALDGVTGGAKVTECATEGCSHQAMVHFIRGGVGSYYCNECYLRVQALTGQPS